MVVHAAYLFFAKSALGALGGDFKFLASMSNKSN